TSPIASPRSAAWPAAATAASSSTCAARFARRCWPSCATSAPRPCRAIASSTRPWRRPPDRNRPLRPAPYDRAMTRFMTLDFADGDRAALLAEVVERARGPYGYVVTPNVDHVIKLMDGRVPADVYRGAGLHVCDSRILAHLARLRGRRLSVYPGSDLTADLLASDVGADLTYAVFGPDLEAFHTLAARFPRRRFVFIEAPMLTPGTPAWLAAVDNAAKAEWDVLLAC